MLSRKNALSVSIIFSVLCWLALTIIDLIILFSEINNSPSGIAPAIPKLLLIALFVMVYSSFWYLVKKTESINIIDLLWRVFVTGLVTTVISLIMFLFLRLLGTSQFAQNPLLINFFYHINIGLISIFLISTLLVWKKLILYQKSKTLVKIWRVFLYALFISLFLTLFNYRIFGTFYFIVLGILVILGILLSVNLKWVAYLNFKQKWKSILLIILIILYLWYFFVDLFRYYSEYNIQINLISNASIVALFAFIFIYAIFSLLVILFNLPTSSVFEQKLEEVINFQRLSQSSHTGQNEEQVYDILLDSSVSAVMANAAWLEIQSENEVELKLLTYQINREQIKNVKKKIDSRKLKKLMEADPSKKISGSKYISSLPSSFYKSLLIFPLYVQNRHIGTLALLKDVSDGFNKEMVEIIRTFVSQASISIENFRLLSEAIVNERYKEELKIAKRVQRSLLPDKLEHNSDFEITAFSKAADEVGGDYYDTYMISEHKIAIIIGDVSGKGTSAAFNMSQMKGVFHSLVQLDLSARDFMIHANTALSNCLEKTSFITISFFIIDTVEKKVSFSRAGHCPTLIYSSKNQNAEYFKGKGLGLGILRNDNFKNFIEVQEINYRKGDVIFLFTDGIVEAKNKEQDFYGYDRLKQLLQHIAYKNPVSIQADLLKDLYTFCDREPPGDDFTTCIIKFK